MSVGKKGHFFFALQLAMIFVFIAILGFSISSNDIFMGKTNTLIELLSGYRKWYNVLFYETIILSAAGIILNLLIVLSVNKSSNIGPQHIWGGLLSAIAIIAVMTAIGSGDNLQEYGKWAAEDIAAMESGELATIQIASLSGTGYSERLPVPRGGNLPKNLRCFQVYDERSMQVDIYVLDNEYEQIRTMMENVLTAQVDYGNLIGNHQDIDTEYLVKYTPRFYIVVEITPVKIGW